jgi:hypothetical protein
MKTKTVVFAIILPVVAVALILFFGLPFLVMTAVNTARSKAQIAVAQSNVMCLDTALQAYVMDTGKYPGGTVKDGENGFPELFEALCGEKPPKGKGGPNAPYYPLRESNEVLVRDATGGAYRPATPQEIHDPAIGKYLVDPWGKPYVYRENRSKKPEPRMHNREKADIYSLGPDGVDATIEGKADDDIGNW